jgi:hypothetical protein
MHVHHPLTLGRIQRCPSYAASLFAPILTCSDISSAVCLSWCLTHVSQVWNGNPHAVPLRLANLAGYFD